MKNLKKINREELKSIKGGYPKDPGEGGICIAMWRYCRTDDTCWPEVEFRRRCPNDNY